jgi:DNA-binding MarR family transcriptional regulator
VALLNTAADMVVEELHTRMEAIGYGDVRQAHGCVFGNVVGEGGMRLTELAERARMTKQGVGEAVSDLERLGYAERVPDPSDGRAKIIRLTASGRAAQRAGFETIAQIEREWCERFGEQPVEAARALLGELVASPMGAPGASAEPAAAWPAAASAA